MTDNETHSNEIPDASDTVANRRELPQGLVLQRVTDDFTIETVPKGLLKAHRIAEGVWGLLKVRSGSVRFLEEIEPSYSAEIGPGEQHVVRPGVPHRVEPSKDAVFAIEFHR